MKMQMNGVQCPGVTGLGCRARYIILNACLWQTKQTVF